MYKMHISGWLHVIFESNHTSLRMKSHELKSLKPQFKKEKKKEKKEKEIHISGKLRRTIRKFIK